VCGIAHSQAIDASTLRQTVAYSRLQAVAIYTDSCSVYRNPELPIHGPAPVRGNEMMDQNRDVSQRSRSRLTGSLYLLYFLTTILGMILVTRGFAAFGNAINVFSTVCYLVVTFLFYRLFKPVSFPLSLLAALFSLGGCVLMSLGLFNLDSPFSPLLFFGPFCLMLGYLILRSRFLPRILGVAMAVAGLGWLAFLLPAVPPFLSDAIEVFGFLAELSLCLWLLVMGVKEDRWNKLAGAANPSIQAVEPPSAVDRASTPAQS